MTVVLLALAASFASAADSNDDGCEDSYFDANGACVASSAVIGSGATVGTDAVVGPNSTVGTDTSLQTDTFVGARSVLVGRVGLSGARVVGNGTIIARGVYIDADHAIGTDNTIGRATTIGERLDTGANVSIGYGATLGDDVTIGAGAVIGSLVGLGAKTEVEASATLARGVTIADSTTAGTIGGVVGPNVSIGADNIIATTSRIRKDATLGNDVTVLGNARIARSATIANGVTIGANARIGPGATVTATTMVPDDAVIPRGETYDDPSSAGTQTNPGASCQTIHNAFPSYASGPYWVDPTGGSANDAVQVYCEMTVSDGGWTRIATVDASVYVCSLELALGSPADVLNSTGTAWFDSATAQAFAANNEVLIANSPTFWTQYRSDASSFTWEAVADGRVGTDTNTSYGVLFKRNSGSSFSALPQGQCNAITGGDCLMGGYSGGTWTNSLGIGSHTSSNTHNQVACQSAITSSWRGLLNQNGWNQSGEVYVR